MPEKLIPFSAEYMAEQSRLIALLKDAHDDPDNKEKRDAVNESMARLGFSGSLSSDPEAGASHDQI